jgi:hypothetical protein
MQKKERDISESFLKKILKDNDIRQLFDALNRESFCRKNIEIFL